MPIEMILHVEFAASAVVEEKTARQRRAARAPWNRGTWISWLSYKVLVNSFARDCIVSGFFLNDFSLNA